MKTLFFLLANGGDWHTEEDLWKNIHAMAHHTTDGHSELETDSEKEKKQRGWTLTILGKNNIFS